MSDLPQTLGQSPDEAELERALAALEAPSADGPLSELELLAGEALVGWLGDEPPLDPALHAALLEDAQRFFGDAAPAPTAPVARPAAAPPSPGLSNAGWGWLVAAVVLLSLAVGRWQATPPAPLPRPSLREQLAQAPDRVQLAFGATSEGQAAYGDVQGEVVWSPSRQQGYMTFRGLPQNTPSAAQYQLWIVDPSRDANPVDGGVFDVTAGGEVLIPIDAKLRVDDAQAFAITLEQPGGVVVSGGPLLLVAAP